MIKGEEALLARIKECSKIIYDRMNRPHHNWDHAERVYRRAGVICSAEKAEKTEKADRFIVLASALLHDIGYMYGAENHALAGARECREKILPGLNIPGPVIERICHCIEAHDHNTEIPPQTIEAKIVWDADLLEKSDWEGIIRGSFQNVAVEFGITAPEFARMFVKKFKPIFYTRKAVEMDNGRLDLIIKLFARTF